jgi:molybdopterin converting factor subunit 1
MIDIIYFASLKTIVGKDRDSLDLGPETTVRQLAEVISKTSPQMGEMIREKKVMISVNQDMADSETIIHDGDEVAFLPPFSGGS